MGIYLGQLPPAEIARFKAELAETISASFCYPRFFDYRTESLQTRPIDRAKRQEVWLYLSSVDFTAWSRVDLTSADFPHHIERLFIQFVQRNRSFFGVQGRRRMLDIRLSISTSAGSVAQRLRNHLTGQPITPLFGSPRPVLSWTTTPISGRPEPVWEQVMASTMELQRQIQEWRGEVQTLPSVEEQATSTLASAPGPNSRPVLADAPSSVNATNGQGSRPSRPQQVPVNPANPMTPAASFDHAVMASQQPTMPTPPVTGYPAQPLAQPSQYNRGVVPASAPVAPASSNGVKATVQSSTSPAVSRRMTGNITPPVEQNMSARQSGGVHVKIATSPVPVASPVRPPAPVVPPAEPSPTSRRSTGNLARPVEARAPSLPDTVVSIPGGPHPARPVTTSVLGGSTSSIAANGSGQRDVFTIGEDDIAIFEQMRHQLVLWLRIEAVTIGLDVSGQGPAQLLEMLRQQARYDETRLQIVSTLLNLAAQVIKTGTVSVLDYKQALTFHLMHTRRA